MFAEASSAADLCCRLLMQRTLLREQQHLSRKSRVVTLRKAAPPPAAAAASPPPTGPAAGGARLTAAAPEGPAVRFALADPASPSAAEDGGKPDGGGREAAAERGKAPPAEAAAFSPPDAFDVSFSSSCSSGRSEPDSACPPFSPDTSGSAPAEGAAPASPASATLVVTSATAAPPEASVPPELVDRFRAVLVELLLERCRSSSWDPRYPMLGNAYRAVSRLSPGCSMDQMLLRAAEEAGLDADVLRECLPRDFVIWIDPGTVSYRVGDHGATMTLMDQGRVIPPTTTPPSAVATAADAGAHAPSSAPPSRLQLPLPRGAPVVRGFAVSATPRPQQQPKPLAVNPYAAPRGSTSGPATLPPHQAGGPWSAPRAAFRFSEQAPPATVRHHQQQQQQQREPAKNAMAVPPLSGSPQHPAAVPPQPVPVHRVHFGLAHPHTPYGGIFAHQPDPAAVKISSPPASPPQTVSKRPAYIMAN